MPKRDDDDDDDNDIVLQKRCSTRCIFHRYDEFVNPSPSRSAKRVDERFSLASYFREE